MAAVSVVAYCHPHHIAPMPVVVAAVAAARHDKPHDDGRCRYQCSCCGCHYPWCTNGSSERMDPGAALVAASEDAAAVDDRY